MNKKFIIAIGVIISIVFICVAYFFVIKKQAKHEISVNDQVVETENLSEPKVAVKNEEINQNKSSDENQLAEKDLPKEIENLPEFKEFVKNRNGEINTRLFPFKFSNEDKLNLKPLTIEDFKVFDESGNPIFLPSEPASRWKKEVYSPDKNYASEIMTSDPDMFVSLWDLKEKNFYSIAMCGTVCGFHNLVWLDNNRFVIFGSSESFEENIAPGTLYNKFITIYNLKDLSETWYYSRSMPYEELR
jgi:hypothetical protein